jgi:hypothetical protein
MDQMHELFHRNVSRDVRVTLQSIKVHSTVVTIGLHQPRGPIGEVTATSAHGRHLPEGRSGLCLARRCDTWDRSGYGLSSGWTYPGILHHDGRARFENSFPCGTTFRTTLYDVVEMELEISPASLRMYGNILLLCALPALRQSADDISVRQLQAPLVDPHSPRKTLHRVRGSQRIIHQTLDRPIVHPPRDITIIVPGCCMWQLVYTLIYL